MLLIPKKKKLITELKAKKVNLGKTDGYYTSVNNSKNVCGLYNYKRFYIICDK